MPLEDWLARVHLDDRDRVKANLEACVRGETPRWLAEYRVIADEDNWRWLRTESAVTDVDEEGMPLTISGTLRDIHDKHTLEAQARQLEADRTMIQEVHHRVKNNLQIVSSLLSFQQNRAEDESVAREFEVTRNRVAAVASLHETLYRSDTLKSVRMGALLHDLTRDIRQSYGIVGSQLVLDAGSSEVMIPFDMAGPCALVVNEWVTNAIKHAFADGPIGEIRVELDCQNEDQMVQVRVRDNGEGMKPKSERRSGSLGLKLVQRLSSQLEGTAEMLPSEQGTCWSLKFPVTP